MPLTLYVGAVAVVFCVGGFGFVVGVIILRFIFGIRSVGFSLVVDAGEHMLAVETMLVVQSTVL